MPNCPPLQGHGGVRGVCVEGAGVKGKGIGLFFCSRLLSGLFQGACIASAAGKEAPIKGTFTSGRAGFCADSRGGCPRPLRSLPSQAVMNTVCVWGGDAVVTPILQLRKLRSREVE